MEEVSVENQRALEDMNWDERIKAARAQRETILKAKATESGGPNTGPEAAAGIDVRTVERLRFGSENDSVVGPAPEREKQNTRKRLIVFLALAFLGGFASALGLFSVGEQRSKGPVLAEAGSGGVLDYIQASIVAVAQPSPVLAVVVLPEGASQAPSMTAGSQDLLANDILVPAGSAARNKEALGRDTPTFDAGQGRALDGLPAVHSPALPPLIAASSESPVGVQPAILDLGPALPARFSVADGLAAQQVDQTEPSAGWPGPGTGRLSNQPATSRAVAEPVLEVALPAAVAVPRPKLSLALDPLLPTTWSEANAGVVLADTPTKVALPAYTESPVLVSSRDPLPKLDLTTPHPIVPGGKDVMVRVYATPQASRRSVANLAASIRALRLEPVEIDQLAFGISYSQVRFFDASSEAPARFLADKLGARLKDLRDSGLRHAPGTLEIYVAGNAQSTRFTRTVRLDQSQEPAPEAIGPRVLSELEQDGVQ